MASKRRIRRHQCGDKKRHDTAEDAYAHRRHLKRDTGDISAIDVYRCKFCRKWHIGHRPKV